MNKAEHFLGRYPEAAGGFGSLEQISGHLHLQRDIGRSQVYGSFPAENSVVSSLIVTSSGTRPYIAAVGGATLRPELQFELPPGRDSPFPAGDVPPPITGAPPHRRKRSDQRMDPLNRHSVKPAVTVGVTIIDTGQRIGQGAKPVAVVTGTINGSSEPETQRWRGLFTTSVWPGCHEFSRGRSGRPPLATARLTRHNTTSVVCGAMSGRGRAVTGADRQRQHRELAPPGSTELSKLEAPMPEMTKEEFVADPGSWWLLEEYPVHSVDARRKALGASFGWTDLTWYTQERNLTEVYELVKDTQLFRELDQATDEEKRTRWLASVIKLKTPVESEQPTAAASPPTAAAGTAGSGADSGDPYPSPPAARLSGRGQSPRRMLAHQGAGRLGTGDGAHQCPARPPLGLRPQGRNATRALGRGRRKHAGVRRQRTDRGAGGGGPGRDPDRDVRAVGR